MPTLAIDANEVQMNVEDILSSVAGMTSSVTNSTDAEVPVTTKMPPSAAFLRADPNHFVLISIPFVQVHVVDMSLADAEAAAAILHACVTTGFFYGMPHRRNMTFPSTCRQLLSYVDEFQFQTMECRSE